MSKWILAALLCSVAASAAGQAPTAQAAAQASIDEVRVSTPRIVLPETLRNMWPEEFDAIKGDYKLSNGKWVRLSMWGNRMYARIDGRPRTQLIAVTPYEFVALNESMKLSIDTWSPHANTAVIVLADQRLAGQPGYDFTRLTASR